MAQDVLQDATSFFRKMLNSTIQDRKRNTRLLFFAAKAANTINSRSDFFGSPNVRVAVDAVDGTEGWAQKLHNVDQCGTLYSSIFPNFAAIGVVACSL